MLKSFTKAYQYLIYFSAFLKSPILLLCRLYWGWGFMHSGWIKLQDIEKFANSLETLNVSLPYFNAYLVGYLEFFGGLFLLLGFASRLIAIPLIIEMAFAYAIVHFEAVKLILDNPDKFVAQAPFNYLFVCLLVLAFGPGRFSLDYILERRVFHRAQAFPTHQHLPPRE